MAAGTPIQDEEYRYDDCAASDTPSDFTCTNVLGRPTMSRAIVQCGASHEIVKRGRWYAFDNAGRLSQIAYATTSVSTIEPAVTMSYAYDSADRVRSMTSPLGAAFGTSYTYGAADGRVATMSTTSGVEAAIGSDFRYRSFGSLVSYRTASVQPVDGGARTLEVVNGYRQDNGLDVVRRTFVGNGSVPSIDLMNQTIAYTPAGMIGGRNDAADSPASRHYDYDALQRLVCEVKDGTSADCTMSSSRPRSLFTYGDGQDAAHPPDARTSAYVNRSDLGYVSTAVETYIYTGGSGQTQAVTRSNGGIAIVHDALGRRIADYQEGGAPTSRRDYTYLPNGQVGTIMGWTTAGASYTISIRYDEEGRPNTIAYNPGQRYELFWDTADRLVAVSILGSSNIRWHYHYLGAELVAATRELPDSGEVKRFWMISDERGMIARLVDEVGATYWQAEWDATGWRHVQHRQPEMWVPFGLPGQVILDGTEAGSANPEASLRPPIALNQLRAYDPLLGAFLQPDVADQTGRLLPEGYLYARGDYVERADPTGAYSKDLDHLNKKIPIKARRSFDDSCVSKSKAVHEILRDQELINQIASDVDRCKNGSCGEPRIGPNIKKQWKIALLTGRYFCAYSTYNKKIDPRKDKNAIVWHGSRWQVYGRGADFYGGDAWVGMPRGVRDDGEVLDNSWARTITPEGDLYTRQTLVGQAPTGGCWARMVAHEALHGVIDSIPITDAQMVVPPDLRGYTWGTGLSGTGHEVIMGAGGLEECIRCNKQSK